MLEKITQILKDYKGDDSIEVTENTTFESLGLDSLDTVQLVMDFEEAFGVTVEMDRSITNVAGLMKVIESASN